MGLSFKNLSIYLLMIGYLFAIRKQGAFFNRNTLNKYLLFMLIYIVISMFPSLLSPEADIRTLKTHLVSLKLFINPWIIFFLITHIIDNKKTCKNTMLGLTILLVITVLTMVIDNLTSIDLGTHPKKFSFKGRSAGFAEANQYAVFLVLLLPSFLSSILFQKKSGKSTINSVLFLVGLMGLILTISRGGFISFIFAVAALFIIAYRHRMIGGKRIIVFGLLFFLIAPVSYIIVPSDVKDVVKQRVVDPTDQTYNPWRVEKHWIHGYSSGRIKLWMQSLQMFIQKPVFGYGNDACKRVFEFPTHNDYLEILINYGIIGFFLFIMIYIRIFLHVYFHFKASTERLDKMFYLGYLSGFVGYIVAMFGVNLGEPRFIFWIYTAVMYKYSQLDTMNKT
jgi:O-antigen ligase